MSASSGSIAIIGAGSVGAAIAYSLLLRQVVADLILVDINQEYCQAQVEDLSDATFLSNVRIRQGTADDARNADIIIISAGAKQKPGETRIGLIGISRFWRV
jgi:L-lactate dehydrogenase